MSFVPIFKSDPFIFIEVYVIQIFVTGKAVGTDHMTSKGSECLFGITAAVKDQSDIGHVNIQCFEFFSNQLREIRIFGFIVLVSFIQFPDQRYLQDIRSNHGETELPEIISFLFVMASGTDHASLILTVNESEVIRVIQMEGSWIYLVNGE